MRDAGEGEWMVVEADESDGTFPQALPARSRSVTNIGAEHLDHYCNFGRGAARASGSSVRERACLRLRRDVPQHPEVQALVSRIEDGGSSPVWAITRNRMGRYSNPPHGRAWSSVFDVGDPQAARPARGSEKDSWICRLPMPGQAQLSPMPSRPFAVAIAGSDARADPPQGLSEAVRRGKAPLVRTHTGTVGTEVEIFAITPRARSRFKAVCRGRRDACQGR